MNNPIYSLSLRNRVISLMSIFATLLVVIRHGFNLHLFYENGNPWMPVLDWNVGLQIIISRATDIAIPIFFLISGYLFFVSLNDLSDISQKLRRRIQSLLIPFLAWNLIYLILWCSLSMLPQLHDSVINAYGVEWNALWFVKKITLAPIAGVFWYIRTLMLFCLATPLLFLLYERLWLTLPLLVILFLRWKAIDCSLLSTEGMLFFTLGGFAGKRNWEFQTINRKWFIALGVWGIIMLLLPFVGISFRYQGALTIGLLSSGLLGFVLVLAQNKTGEVVLKLSPYSFGLFALHGLFLGPLRISFARILPHTPLFCFLGFSAGIAICLGLCLIISCAINHLSPGLWAFLTGGRNNTHHAKTSS